MSRSRTVKPEVTRLYLVDVHRRALADLMALTGADAATAEQIRTAERKVRQATADADWIDVKRRLNAGEQRKMFARMTSHLTPGEKLRLDAEFVGLTKVLEYLVGWSFLDGEKPLPMSPEMPIEARRAALGEIDPESFGEVLAAIEWHEDHQAEVRDAEKNSQGGESESSAISPSPNIMAGATNG